MKSIAARNVSVHYETIDTRIGFVNAVLAALGSFYEKHSYVSRLRLASHLKSVFVATASSKPVFVLSYADAESADNAQIVYLGFQTPCTDRDALKIADVLDKPWKRLLSKDRAEGPQGPQRVRINGSTTNARIGAGGFLGGMLTKWPLSRWWGKTPAELRESVPAIRNDPVEDLDNDLFAERQEAARRNESAAMNGVQAELATAVESVDWRAVQPQARVSRFFEVVRGVGNSVYNEFLGVVRSDDALDNIVTGLVVVAMTGIVTSGSSKVVQQCVECFLQLVGGYILVKKLVGGVKLVAGAVGSRLAELFQVPADWARRIDLRSRAIRAGEMLGGITSIAAGGVLAHLLTLLYGSAVAQASVLLVTQASHQALIQSVCFGLSRCIGPATSLYAMANGVATVGPVAGTGMLLFGLHLLNAVLTLRAFWFVYDGCGIGEAAGTVASKVGALLYAVPGVAPAAGTIKRLVESAPGFEDFANIMMGLYCKLPTARAAISLVAVASVTGSMSSGLVVLGTALMPAATILCEIFVAAAWDLATALAWIMTFVISAVTAIAGSPYGLGIGIATAASIVGYATYGFLRNLNRRESIMNMATGALEMIGTVDPDVAHALEQAGTDETSGEGLDDPMELVENETSSHPNASAFLATCTTEFLMSGRSERLEQRTESLEKLAREKKTRARKAGGRDESATEENQAAVPVVAPVYVKEENAVREKRKRLTQTERLIREKDEFLARGNKRKRQHLVPTTNAVLRELKREQGYEDVDEHHDDEEEEIDYDAPRKRFRKGKD